MTLTHVVWLTVALPLAGFLANGALALWRPQAKSLVSVVGAGTLLGAFAVSAGIFLELWRDPPHAPVIVTLWPWLPVDRLQVDLAFQVDQLSVVMLLNLGHRSNDLRGPSGIAAALVIAGLLAIELTVLWRYTPRRLAAEVAQAGAADVASAFPAGQMMQRAAAHNVVQAIAEPMFRVYLVPFEITSVLLLAALVGAVVLAKRRI